MVEKGRPTVVVLSVGTEQTFSRSRSAVARTLAVAAAAALISAADGVSNSNRENRIRK